MQELSANVVEENLVVGGGFRIERGWVDGGELLLEVVQGSDLSLCAGSRIVFELRVILMQPGGGTLGWRELEEDVLEVLAAEIVEGLAGAVGGDVLRLCW